MYLDLYFLLVKAWVPLKASDTSFSECLYWEDPLNHFLLHSNTHVSVTRIAGAAVGSAGACVIIPKGSDSVWGPGIYILNKYLCLFWWLLSLDEYI